MKDLSDLKAQFRQLALQTHPDHNPSGKAHQDFLQLIQAYEFAQTHFDEILAELGIEDVEETIKSDEAQIDDVFADLFDFGTSGRVIGYQEPEDLYLDVQDFLKGKEFVQMRAAYLRCLDCFGSGVPQGESAKICTHCFGKGYLQTHQGFKGCKVCKGKGRKMVKACSSCNGFGRLKVKRKQKFTVPAGLELGRWHILESVDVKTRRPGQLFIIPRVYKDSRFQIDQSDLLCDCAVDFKNLQQTKRLSLTTPLGPVSFEVTPQSKPGDQVTLEGCGPFLNVQQTKRGNLRIRLVPKKVGFFKKLFG